MIFNTLSIVMLAVDALLLVYLAFGEKIANKIVKSRKITFSKTAYVAPIISVLYATLALQVVYNAQTTGKKLTAFDFINILDAAKKLFGASVSPGALIEQSTAYYFALLFGALLSLSFTVLVAIKVVLYFFYNKRGVKRAIRKGGCDVYLGYDENTSYGKNTIVWLENTPSEDVRKNLQSNGIHYLVESFTAENLQRHFGKYPQNKFGFVVSNRVDYFACVGQFEKFLRSVVKAENDFAQCKMYLMMDYKNYFTIRDRILTDKLRVNHIVCVNMHEMMATKFVSEYPITKHLDEQFIDYDTATINEDCQINVLYVGFGKVAYSLFFNSVINDQLVCAKRTKNGYVFSPKLVNYYAYDKNEVFQDGSNYNHSYGKYQAGILQNEKYFPVPPVPCNFRYNGKFDINSQAFWQDISAILQTPNAHNRIFVSVGNDEDNIDETTKLLLFMRQCGLKNFHIFVRVQNKSEVLNTLFGADQKYVTYFGKDLSAKEIENIADEQLAEAKLYNSIYEQKNKGDVQNAWKSVYNQRSSNYAGINFALKLDMIGCQVVEGTNAPTDSLAQKVADYSVDDLPYEQRLYLPVESRHQLHPARALAYQEKLRWNAFMMAHRFVPMPISEVEQTGTTKNFITMKHACLTTVEGLDQLHRLLAKMQNAPLEDVDTYKYDYNFREKMVQVLQENKQIVAKK